MKKKILIIIIFLIILLILLAVIELLSNSLRKQEELIRVDLLEVMPFGTSMEDVINIVNNHEKWEIFGRVFNDSGIIIGPRGPSMGYPLSDEKIVGHKSMGIHLGKYLAYFFIETDVVAYIAFDENSNLIEIAIRKSSNVL